MEHSDALHHTAQHPPAPPGQGVTVGTAASPHQRRDRPHVPATGSSLEEQTSPSVGKNRADGEDQTHLWSPGGSDESSGLSPSSALGQEAAGGSGGTRGGRRDTAHANGPASPSRGPSSPPLTHPLPPISSSPLHELPAFTH